MRGNFSNHEIVSFEKTDISNSSSLNIVGGPEELGIMTDGPKQPSSITSGSDFSLGFSSEDFGILNNAHLFSTFGLDDGLGLLSSKGKAVKSPTVGSLTPANLGLISIGKSYSS